MATRRRVCALLLTSWLSACDDTCAPELERDARRSPRVTAVSCAGDETTLGCVAGTADCDGDPRVPCETTVYADERNCGACGRRCGADAVCVVGRCVAYGVRPRSPVSPQSLRSPRPTLRWDLSATATGARVELCRTYACDDVVGRWEVEGASLRLPAPLPIGTYYWRLYAHRGGAWDAAPGPTWRFDVVAAPVSTGSIDLNGDGFGDRIHSRYLGTDDNPLGPNPSAGVEYGTLGGTIPPIGPAEQRFDQLAYIPINGDLDCDGYGDFYTYTRSAPFVAGRSALISGRSFVAFGSLTWRQLAMHTTADFNGDGCVDLTFPPEEGFVFEVEVVTLGRWDDAPARILPHLNVDASRWPPASGVIDWNDDGFDDLARRPVPRPEEPAASLEVMDLRGGPGGLRDALAP